MMENNKYWIKVHRKIRESALWESNEAFDRRSAWIDLLMEANVKDHDVCYKGAVIKVKRGDVYTSIRKLATRWHWSTGKVTRFLKILEDLNMIRKNKRIKSVTLLTIVNYGIYQDKRNTDRDTDETQTEHGRDTDGVLLKNVKESKESKESDTPPSDEVAVAEEENPSMMTDEEWEALGDSV